MKAKRKSGWWLVLIGFLFVFPYTKFNNPSWARAQEPSPAAPAVFSFPVFPQVQFGLPLDEPEISMHGSKTTFYARRNRRMHQALDLRAKIGMALYAVESGEIHTFWMGGKNRRSGGYTVALMTPQWIIRYLHTDQKATEARIRALREAALIDGSQPGDPFWVDKDGRLFVSRGVIIGYSGRTGTAAPHLHFQVNPLEGPSVNPLRFYTKACITEINDHPFLYAPASPQLVMERKLKVRVKVDTLITNYGPMEVRLFVDSEPRYQWQVVNFNADFSREIIFEVELPDNQPHSLFVSVADNQYAQNYTRTKVSYLRQWWQDSNNLNQQIAFARAEVRYAGLVEVKKPEEAVKTPPAEEKGKLQ
jgi:hypothetical protein